MDIITHPSGIIGAVESCIGGRSENQDDYGWADTKLGLFMLVCDGMGGGPAGKTASSLARMAMIKYVSGASVDSDPELILKNAVDRANRKLLAAISENPTLQGMGTTCIGLLINGKKGYIVHTGDSRLYQLRNGAKVFRTTDHSYVAELVKRGNLSEEEARNSKMSNVITCAIGVQKTVDPEIDVVKIKDGDRFALMTDGIWGTMPEGRLVSRLGNRSADSTTIVLDMIASVDEAGHNGGGGHDNLTLLMVDVDGKTGVKAAASKRTDLNKESMARSHAVTPEPEKENEIAGVDYSVEQADASTPRNVWKAVSIGLGLLLMASIALNVLLFTGVLNDNDRERESEAVIEKAAGIVQKNSEENLRNRRTIEKVRNQNLEESGARLAEAKANLEALSNYGSEDGNYSNSTMRNERISERRKKQQAVDYLLEKSLQLETDQTRRRKIARLRERIGNDAYIVNGIDKKGLTTFQAQQSIIKYIKELDELISAMED